LLHHFAEFLATRGGIECLIPPDLVPAVVARRLAALGFGRLAHLIG